ncbi:hypothetical protein HY640_00120 [Candidatus Woesearchaeota archaeon]|nr:hypothetical protein [Candidatus Woesearchaeota archaeon]
MNLTKMYSSLIERLFSVEEIGRGQVSHASIKREAISYAGGSDGWAFSSYDVPACKVEATLVDRHGGIEEKVSFYVGSCVKLEQGDTVVLVRNRFFGFEYFEYSIE